MTWGSKEWFSDKIVTQGVDNPGAYFAHKKNGYQRYRHAKLTALILDIGIRTGRKNLRFAEIGCGTGGLIKSFFDKFSPKYAIGTDFVKEAVQVGKIHYPNIIFEEGTLPELSPNIKNMDLIIASEVMYYLKPDDQIKVIENVRDALAPDGLFLITSVLGAEYGDEEDAISLIQSKFKIIKIDYHHHKLYHKLTKPAALLSSARFRLYSGTAGLNKRHEEFISRHRVILNNNAIKSLINAADRIFGNILRSVILPNVCEKLSKIISSDKSKTNIVILAQKYDT